MTLAGTNVLLVGQNFQMAQALTERLLRLEFRCHFAADVRGASRFLAAHPVDLVLSNTHLLDGTGYRLLMNLARLPFPHSFVFPSKIAAFGCPP